MTSSVAERIISNDRDDKRANGVAGAMRRVTRYVFFERNPLVQCLYVAVMCSSYFLFVTEAHPLIPNVYVAGYHKWLVGALFIACFALFVFLCRSDPGVIHAHNVNTFTHYPTHPVLFPEGKFCRTCKTPKLPRSKHCSMCNRCVARFDHHCIWFNGCVGANNYRHFLLFLVVQLALCIYVFYLSSSVFLVLTEPLLAKRKRDADAALQNERTEMTAALQHIVATHQSLGFVAAITLMIGLVVWLFLLMQLRRIASNTTANETFKRDDLVDAAELDSETTGRRLLHTLLQTLRRKTRNPSRRSTESRSERKKALDASWGGTFSPDVILNTEASFSASDVRFNPYDLGSFWRNLMDALQVRSRQAAARPSHSHSHSHSRDEPCNCSKSASKQRNPKPKQS